jgi:hypothetical protein
MKLLGIISVGFGVTDQIFCICHIMEGKNGSAMRQYISYS